MALAYVGPIMLATHSQEPFHGGYATRKAASAISAHRSTQSLGVAVLYSGRFYGALTPKEWVRDHMEHEQRAADVDRATSTSPRDKTKYHTL